LNILRSQTTRSTLVLFGVLSNTVKVFVISVIYRIVFKIIQILERGL